MSSIKHKIDKGRVIIVPVFFLLLLGNILNTYKYFLHLAPTDFAKIAGLIHGILIICFYVLIIMLYFLRTSVKSSSSSMVTNTIAVIATFTPFAIPFIGKPLQDPYVLAIANSIIVLGMVFSIYALKMLGRSFSIIPQARKLVQDGPYRIIRHPLYVGELISIAGIVLARFALPTILLFLFLASLQVYRALKEENLLSTTFPEYTEYSMKTARFIPGIF